MPTIFLATAFHNQPSDPQVDSHESIWALTNVIRLGIGNEFHIATNPDHAFAIHIALIASDLKLHKAVTIYLSEQFQDPPIIADKEVGGEIHIVRVAQPPYQHPASQETKTLIRTALFREHPIAAIGIGGTSDTVADLLAFMDAFDGPIFPLVQTGGAIAQQFDLFAKRIPDELLQDVRESRTHLATTRKIGSFLKRTLL